MKEVAAGHREWPERLYLETAASYTEHLPWSDPVATALSLRIAGCHNAMSEATVRALNQAGFAGSQVRYSVLRSLFFAENHCLTHADTSRRVSVSPGTLTRVVDGMETDGLVARLTDPTDRRVTLIQLTPMGKDMSKRLVPVVARLRTELFEVFSEDEKQTLTTLLRRLQERVERSAAANR